MCKHQTRHASVGLHHACGCEMYADRAQIDKFVEQEIDAGVGQRGVANGRTDTLIRLFKQLLWLKLLVGCITPIMFPHLLVHAFGRSFGQSFAQNLGHHLLVVVVFEVVFNACVYCGGKCAHLIFYAAG